MRRLGPALVLLGTLSLSVLTAAALLRVSRKPEVVAGWRELAATGTRLGSNGAWLEIVMFTDFQCPYCAPAHALLEDAIARHAGRIAVRVRHLPLPQHQHAYDAAVASECAALQGRFAAFAHALFARQDAMGITAWEEFARQAEVPDTAAFSRCMRDRATAAIVERDLRAADDAGILGTPTLLVRERLFRGVPDPTELDRHIDDALGGSR